MIRDAYSLSHHGVKAGALCQGQVWGHTTVIRQSIWSEFTVIQIGSLLKQELYGFFYLHVQQYSHLSKNTFIIIVLVGKSGVVSDTLPTMWLGPFTDFAVVGYPPAVTCSLYK